MRIIVIYILLFFSDLLARDLGQTEITTEEGIEVYQKEKYYLLKKNVQIEADNFKLTADNVKVSFKKDLYDITDIYAQGNVILESDQGLKVLGYEVEYNVKNQNILIRGKNNFLKNNQFTMISDKSISLNNMKGEFKLSGTNSQLISDKMNITGEYIDGKFFDDNGEKMIESLKAEDSNHVNIITETLNMFAIKAEYNKSTNIIELFDKVKIIRNNESITGDHAEINTMDESYKIKSKDSKRVKVILEQANE